MASIAPLQLYCSGLVFAPAQSIVKQTFHNEILKQIQRLPVVEDSWSQSLQTLEGHSGWVSSVAFSPDGLTLASGSDEGTIKLWDTTTGTHRQTLEGHSKSVHAVLNEPKSNLQVPLSNSWITLGGENLLWLPSEYRGSG
jgi:WD40 repeat protein